MQSPAHSSSATPDMSALSLHALRVELHRRHCDTTGVRPVLERRLAAAVAAAGGESADGSSRRLALYSSVTSSVLTVPLAFPRDPTVAHAIPYLGPSSPSPQPPPPPPPLTPPPTVAAPLPRGKSERQARPSSPKRRRTKARNSDELPPIASSRLPNASKQQPEPQPETQLLSRQRPKQQQEQISVTDATAQPLVVPSSAIGSRVRTGTRPGSGVGQEPQRVDKKDVTLPIRGVLRARSVWVSGDPFTAALWEIAGPIGKANLSRSAPTFSRPHTTASKGRALRQRLELEEMQKKTAAGASAATAGSVTPGATVNGCKDGKAAEKNDDTRGDRREDGANRAAISSNGAAIGNGAMTSGSNGAGEGDNGGKNRHEEAQMLQDVEHLQLSLVEAFYCAFVRRALVIYTADDDVAMDDASTVWREFCARGHRFPETFVAYCRYRSAGWVPRSGLKYGVDWVLYAASSGSRHQHAPYCLALRFRDDDSQAPVRLEKRWISLQTKLRLVKNVNKSLIIAEIYANPPLAPVPTVRAAFSSIRIDEVTVDRWIP